MASVSFSHFGVMKYQIPAGSRQGDASDEKDHEHNVREGGCEVHHLQKPPRGGSSERRRSREAECDLHLDTGAAGHFKLFQDGEHSKNTETKGESVRARNKVSEGDIHKAVR